VADPLQFRAPTSEECTTNARVVMSPSRNWKPRELVAAWYPQMGGYVGACWIDPHACSGEARDPDDGFDVYVWHDGEFGFSGEDGRQPVHLHHCAPSQFISFGELVQRIQEKP
jgi:hypothetical protein